MTHCSIQLQFQILMVKQTLKASKMSEVVPMRK